MACANVSTVEDETGGPWPWGFEPTKLYSLLLRLKLPNHCSGLTVTLLTQGSPCLPFLGSEFSSSLLALHPKLVIMHPGLPLPAWHSFANFGSLPPFSPSLPQMTNLKVSLLCSKILRKQACGHVSEGLDRLDKPSWEDLPHPWAVPLYQLGSWTESKTESWLSASSSPASRLWMPCGRPRYAPAAMHFPPGQTACTLEFWPKVNPSPLKLFALLFDYSVKK